MAELLPNKEQHQFEWRDGFIKSFRQNNDFPSSFNEIVRHQSQILRENRMLKIQKESCEKQLLILQHEHTGSAADKVVQQLEDKIRYLQDEVITLGKANQEVGDLRYRLLEADRNLGDVTRALKSVEVVAKRDKEEKERLQAIDGVLQNELELMRSMLAKKEEECEKLRGEMNDIVMRLLEDKASMVSEMNKMNDLVESLKSKLSEYQKRDQDLLGKKAKDFSKSSSMKEEDSYGASVQLGGWSLDNVSIPPTTLRHRIKAHHTEINAVIYSQRDPLLFSGSSDGNIKIWECNTGKSKATLRGTQPILALDSFESSTIAGASTDRSIKLWDLRTERLRLTVTGHSNKVHAVKFTPDGRQLVTGSTDRTIKIWDALSGRELRTLKANSTCNSVDISCDGVSCVSGHQDGSVRLWDIGSGQQITEMGTHSGQVTSTAFSPRGGMQVLTAGRDGQLTLLDSRTLEPLVKITHPALRIGYNWSRSCFSPDGSFIIAGSLNGTVLVFDNGEGGGKSGLNHKNNAGAAGGPQDSGGGRSSFGGFGEAFGNAVGNALSKTNFGNTIGNTLGGSIGSTLVNASGTDANGIPNTLNNNVSGIRCHSQLRSHETAVTTTAWAPGVSGWQQVATADKLGNLFLWD